MRLWLGKLFLALCIFLYGVKDVQALYSCQQIFADSGASPAIIDARYGGIDQLQHLFLEKGLISPQWSMLCGPTCAYNALEKLRVTAHKSISKKSDPQGVVDVVSKADELFTISKEDIVRRGLVDTELTETLRVMLKEEKIPAKVRLVVTSDKVEGAESDFNLADLKKSVQSRAAVIVLTEKYETKDPVQANDYNLVYGHYLIVNGFDPADPQRVFFNDPLRPLEPRAARLVPVHPDSYHSATFQVVFEDNKESPRVVLISSVITMELLSRRSSVDGKSAAEKVAYVSSPRTERARQELESSVQNIQTASEMIQFLENLNQAYGASLHGSWGPVLQKLNLAKILMRLRSENPADPQWEELRKTLLRFNRNFEKGVAPNAGLGGWTYPLLLSLHPEKALDFIDEMKTLSAEGHRSFQELAGGTEFLSFVNPSLYSVYSQLPSGLRRQALLKIRAEMNAIDLANEILIMKDGELHAPQSRTYRRNLEVILRMVVAPELMQLKKDLAHLGKDPLRSLDSYYKSIYEGVGPKRGGYRSLQVVRAARILQMQFAKQLQGENRYIDLYGSFANGKAAFKTSDIDMKISERMFLEIFGHSYRETKEQAFQLYFADYMKSQLGEVPATLRSFWEDYQRAEAQLAAQVFQRSPRQSSELLAMLYPPVPFKDEPGDSRWYNPVTIRIYANKIEIHISDLMSPLEMKTVREVKVP